MSTWGSNLDTLLNELQKLTSTEPVTPVVDQTIDNQLVQVRLGMATSLFMALRCRDPFTAAHALRVALTTSGWCMKMGVAEHERDMMEVAALLHDLGVIGIPDKVLHKPGRLDFREATVVERSRQISAEILRSACSEQMLLDIIEHIPTRYDGSRKGYSLGGQDIPLASRMIAIVESFDSMTTDHVFRPAMSRELALRELFSCAGTQFDPNLVREFANLLSHDQSAFRNHVTSRWLHNLDPEVVESYWELSHNLASKARADVFYLFEDKFLGNMHDAVVFVDENLAVTFWNHGAERMTGINAGSICRRHWTPSLLNARDESGQRIEETDCPVACTVASGVQAMRRLTIQGRNGRPLSVDTQVIPVLAENKKPLGAVVILHDASSETSLEERCQNLHEKSIKDPLTQVGNRAEFDRVHDQFVRAHLQQHRPCSLIICDLDLFKQVNDTYGHQAGDGVIKSMADVLKDSCRAGDLVARYGGEEFVMLCADCDNATAARRAEEIRKNINRISQPLMEGKSISASFGVTEIQPGDSPATMLRRADRALLTAKARGRNRVVQLGTVSTAERPWPFAAESAEDDNLAGKSQNLIEQDMVTSVPMAVAIEKLRGFVADHRAKLVNVKGPDVRLEMLAQPLDGRKRRSSDRPTTFVINLRFEECPHETQQQTCGAGPLVDKLPKTKINISISPKRNRDRRQSNTLDQAREILVSFRSYLMATDEQDQEDGNVELHDQQFIDSWRSSQLAPLDDGNVKPSVAASLWQSIRRCLQHL
ncbi:MAG: diguanylate cyclase, partial [Planctomycetota bacterium]|nr:diguanylate cyclase [Planctomycetota bacterium]